MSFEITFLGCSGGPIEGSNCSILVKPSSISFNDILDNSLHDKLLCIDAGAGLSRLSDIIYSQLHKVHMDGNKTGNDVPTNVLHVYNDSRPVKDYFAESMRLTTPFSALDVYKSPYQLSSNLFKFIGSYLISHPHLDHIYSLAINSPNFTVDNPKEIYGSVDTINALNNHIFNGIIWPNMQEFNILNFNTIDFGDEFVVNSCFSVKLYKLSHGKLTKINNRHTSITVNENFKGTYQEANSITYTSSAFLITHIANNDHLLIFGDFESDLISGLDLNNTIWKDISPLILNKTLSTIILECSNTSCFEHKLYGHLNPDYLFKELLGLRDCCRQINNLETPLKGLNVIVNHVKETDGSFDPRYDILTVLNNLNLEYNLQVNFSIALSGISLVI